MINQRLFDWYGIDTNKNLGLDTFCPRPFDTLLIDKNGSCFACECTAWLPQSLGNLNLQSLDQILVSRLREHLQQSITDGSYRYCNNKQCSYLLDKRPVGWPARPVVTQLKNIRLAIDDSCNLSCPSCRKDKIFIKSGKLLEQRLGLARKILDFLEKQNHLINLHVGSDGDPFASLVYRHFIKETKKLQNIKFSIQTNGLLVKKMYQRNEHMFRKLAVLNVSVDGASRETYEALRRGGSHSMMIENLEFIASIKSKYNFKLRIHFVVQADNYREMPDIIALAEKYKADNVWLNKIANWNTFTNFEEKNIMSSSHAEHARYAAVLKEVKQNIKHAQSRFIEIPTLDNQ